MKAAQVGDKILVSIKHRLGGETGKIIAIGDNSEAQFNHYHIWFDNEVFGTIGKKEIWLCRTDFDIVE